MSSTTTTINRRPKLALAIATAYGIWAPIGFCSSLYTYIRPGILAAATSSIPIQYKTGPVHYFLILINLICLVTMGVAAFQLFKLRKSAVTAFGATFILEAVFAAIELAWKFSFLTSGRFPPLVPVLGVISLLLPLLPVGATFIYVRGLRVKGILT